MLDAGKSSKPPVLTGVFGVKVQTWGISADAWAAPEILQHMVESRGNVMVHGALELRFPMNETTSAWVKSLCPESIVTTLPEQVTPKGVIPESYVVYWSYWPGESGASNPFSASHLLSSLERDMSAEFHGELDKDSYTKLINEISSLDVEIRDKRKRGENVTDLNKKRDQLAQKAFWNSIIGKTIEHHIDSPKFHEISKKLNAIEREFNKVGKEKEDEEKQKKLLALKKQYEATKKELREYVTEGAHPSQVVPLPLDYESEALGDGSKGLCLHSMLEKISALANSKSGYFLAGKNCSQTALEILEEGLPPKNRTEFITPIVTPHLLHQEALRIQSNAPIPSVGKQLGQIAKPIGQLAKPVLNFAYEYAKGFLPPKQEEEPLPPQETYRIAKKSFEDQPLEKAIAGFLKELKAAVELQNVKLKTGEILFIEVDPSILSHFGFDYSEQGNTRAESQGVEFRLHRKTCKEYLDKIESNNEKMKPLEQQKYPSPPKK